jgi:hypothetical protein
MARVTRDVSSEVPAMKWSMVSLAAAVILLLLADLLAFHDLFEPHTVRDWLMLAATVLAVVGLAGGSTRLLGTIDRRG